MNVDNCVLVTLIHRAIEFDVNDDLKIWNIDDDGFTSETCLKNWSAQSLFCSNYVLVCHKREIFYKKIMGCFLQFCNLSQTGIETQRLLGTSCSSKVLSRYRVKKALEQKHAILMMIHDYHSIHTVTRPTEEGNTSGSHGYHHHQDCIKSSSY